MCRLLLGGALLLSLLLLLLWLRRRLRLRSDLDFHLRELSSQLRALLEFRALLGRHGFAVGFQLFLQRAHLPQFFLQRTHALLCFGERGPLNTIASRVALHFVRANKRLCKMRLGLHLRVRSNAARQIRLRVGGFVWSRGNRLQLPVRSQRHSQRGRLVYLGLLFRQLLLFLLLQLLGPVIALQKEVEEFVILAGFFLLIRVLFCRLGNGIWRCKLEA
mmetsp:Transcript_109168/g.307836  ORF Transcript_109168/g.307836 Transcript_109168/m.307836 type:complete len:218 (+) Transcript_109168:144-797(+)